MNGMTRDHISVKYKLDHILPSQKLKPEDKVQSYASHKLYIKVIFKIAQRSQKFVWLHKVHTACTVTSTVKKTPMCNLVAECWGYCCIWIIIPY